MNEEEFTIEKADLENYLYFFLGCDLLGLLISTAIFDINFLQMGPEVFVYFLASPVTNGKNYPAVHQEYIFIILCA